MRKLSLFVLGLFALVWFVAPAAANVRIDINLSAERMHVQADNGQVYDWRISSARRGYITPDGNFRPQSLQVMHYSHKYHNAPMPHAIFFHGGYAIHGGYSAASMGVPRSHGCVRLTNAHAAVLFALVRREGASIHIYGQPPASIYARAARPTYRKPHHVAYRMQRVRITAIRHIRVRYIRYVRHEVRGHWYRRRIVAWRWQTRRYVHYAMVHRIVRARSHALAYAPSYHHAARYPSVRAWQYYPLPSYLLTK
ncbi:MAG: L,D-transpeptidase [Hyphomicrobiales bacterium]|nr:L,D-transpeptidase [Hyphomicrobiales bacterium]